MLRGKDANNNIHRPEKLLCELIGRCRHKIEFKL